MKPGFEGGTWIAMNSRKGHVSVLLNIRQPAVEFRTQNVKGRGNLVPNCLQSLHPETIRKDAEQLRVDQKMLPDEPSYSSCSDAFLQHLQATRNDYNGLVFVTLRLVNRKYSLRYFHSLQNFLSAETFEGVHAFGNHRNLSNPWCKVRHGKRKFETVLIKHNQPIASDNCGSADESRTTVRNCNAIAAKQDATNQSHSINVLIDDLFELFQDPTCFDANGEFAAQMPEMNEQLRTQLTPISLHLPDLRYGSRYEPFFFAFAFYFVFFFHFCS